MLSMFFFFFQAEDGIRDTSVTGVQTCALPISSSTARAECESGRLAGSGCTVRDRQTAPRSLRNRAIGVVRIGPDLCPFDEADGDSRPQAISPERHRPSSHNGSY